MSAFIDTNVLLYADDLDAGEKTPIARELLRERLGQRSGVISTQVLQEFYVNATKKLGLDPAAAQARVELYGGLSVVLIDLELVLAAIELHRLELISFWDALIVRAAERADCDVLYSEDLQHGRRYGRLQVINPFA